MGFGILLMIFAVVAAVFVGGVVVMGMRGKGEDDHPRAARRFSETARAMTGEGDPPAQLAKIFR